MSEKMSQKILIENEDAFVEIGARPMNRRPVSQNAQEKRCPDCGLEDLTLGNVEYSSLFRHCRSCGYTEYLPGGRHVPV